MKYKFYQSSRKHRINSQRARFVIENSAPVEVSRGVGNKSLLQWVGVDNRGVRIEIRGERSGNQIDIFHVMPSKYRLKRRRKK